MTGTDEDYSEIREGVRALCARFPDAYWREVDRERRYPEDFVRALTEAGYLACLIPEAYGGMDGDFINQTILLEAMAEACLLAPYCNTVVLVGSALQLSKTENLKKELLPKIADGKLVCSFALIEPDNSYGYSNIQAAAVKEGDAYLISGTKLFVEYAQSADAV